MIEQITGEQILRMVGIATLVLFGIMTVFVLIAIFIEESNSKIKFWQLAWRKFRKWLQT